MKRPWEEEDAIDGIQFTYLSQIKDTFSEDMPKYDKFLLVMKDFKARRIEITGVQEKVKEIFKGHNKLIMGFNNFLPKRYKITLTDEEPKKMVQYLKTFNFVNNVQKRFKNNYEIYKSFLYIMKSHQEGRLGIDEVYFEVAELFNDHPDLFDDFKSFFPKDSSDLDEYRKMMNLQKKQKKSYDTLRFPDKEKSVQKIEDLASKDKRNGLKKTLRNKGDTSILVNRVEGSMEQNCERDGARERDKYNAKYIGKSIHELDLPKVEDCASYRLLPEDYPLPLTSGRSKLADEVLNNSYVSVSSDNKDSSFKKMCRNKYEERLFACEDDRFEVDMLLELVRSTAKQAEELSNDFCKNSDEPPIHIEDHFTALNLRCIERMYDDHGLEMLDFLRRNPSVAMPGIIARLNQKREELEKYRLECNNVWSQVYFKNHKKLREHHNMYLKKQDPSIVTTKIYFEPFPVKK